MKIISDLYKTFFSKKPKIEDYYVKQSYDSLRQDKRKSKQLNGVCIESCGKAFFCNDCGLIENCNWIEKQHNFDKTKNSILVIDDNPGVVSFLRDDIDSIFKKNRINIGDYNILEFTGNDAVYKFLATLQYYGNLNITKAIIDITYGGSVQTNSGNIRLTGVDIFKALYRLNPSINFCFYTGNLLNPYIRTNKIIMDEFKDIYSENILEHVLYKTSLNMDERIKFFEKKLFNI